MLIFVVIVIFVISLVLLEFYDKPWAFQLLDTGNGCRLEKWGDCLLARPDPQIIWEKSLPKSEWDKTHAVFVSGSKNDKGQWQIIRPLPQPWIISWQDVKFSLKLSPFKHTGVFPEQAAQWEWMIKKISNFSACDRSLRQFPISNSWHSDKFGGSGRLKILNLFAYTGGATIILAKAGCFVTHVDASKPAITWANENARLNNLPQNSIRWVLDDTVKFVKREIKRGAQYGGIIMDPPAFGHGPTGKVWKFNQDLPKLLTDCVRLLSDRAKFLIINGYATNSSAIALNNLLEDAMKLKTGKIEFGELCLKHPIGNFASNGARKNSRLISTGIFARWAST